MTAAGRELAAAQSVRRASRRGSSRPARRKASASQSSASARVVAAPNASAPFQADLAVAVLELLARAARAGLVPADPSPGGGVLRIAFGDRDCGRRGREADRDRLVDRAEREFVLARRRIEMLELHRRRRLRLLEAHLDARHLGDDRFVPLRDQLLEEFERLGLVLVERIALGHAAPADHLPQMVERHQMLAPQVIERLQDHLLLDVAHGFGVLRLTRSA